MASPLRVRANRENAKRSTGPRTEAGKGQASLNALRHGLLSPRISLLYGETPEELAEFHERLYVELAPVGAIEELLTERVISQAWRLRRVLHVERDVLVVGQLEVDDAGELKLGFAYARDARVSSALDNIARYERSLEASLFRNLNELTLLRERRRFDETKPMAMCQTTPLLDQTERVSELGLPQPIELPLRRSA